jgi:hypothetical protein
MRLGKDPNYHVVAHRLDTRIDHQAAEDAHQQPSFGGGMTGGIGESDRFY